MNLVAVFAVSLAALCYEVLLTRFFSFSQWNHLSFMVISIVMFGFGSSGSVLSLVERRRPGWSASMLGSPGFPLLLVICSIAISGSFMAVKNVPLDYFRMPLQWQQGAYLLLTFLLLLIPFFCTGSVISLAFTGMSTRSGWIYFANMTGSAAGAVLPALLLPLLGEGGIVFCCALLLLFLYFPHALVHPGAAARARRRLTGGGRWMLAASGVLVLLTVVPLVYRGGTLLEIRPSPYKLLPQVLQFPDTAVVSRSNTIRGRLDRLKSPYLRFAPGLSLKFADVPPPAEFLVRDGDALFVLYDLNDPRTVPFSRYLQCYAGYAVRPLGAGGKALILQGGGGLSLPCAASAAVREVTLLVEHAGAADLYRRVYSGQGSGLELRILSGNPRRSVAMDHERYDRIQVEAWGPSVPGMASLDQEHLLTAEALTDYLRLLKPGGVLTLSRKLLLPPSDMLKIFASAYAGLQSAGADDPARHMLLIRGWDSYTLLCSPSAFDQDDLSRLRRFCDRRNFDLVFYDGIEPEEANRFNVFPEAFHFREIRSLSRALREGRGEAYFRGYYLDIAPARDDSPFHSRFTRWSKLGALFRSTGSRFYSLFLSGETIVLAVLIIAGLLGLLLLLLPRLSAPHTVRGGEPVHSGGTILYFLLAGAGFMFVEMAFLQGFTFVFGDPVIAFTVVLAELLVLSGIGGAVSARWSGRQLLHVLIAAVALLIVLFPLFGRVEQLLLRTPAAAVGAFGLLAPIALLLGVPFPVGLRLFTSEPRLRAFSWAANGVSSVVASILAVPLAMTWGISRLPLLAALCYALMLTVLVFRGFQRASNRARNSHLSNPMENQGT